MTDENAFLNAIRDNPTDLPLRLVYGDWLEERGDPRASIVRDEVHLASVRHYGGDDRAVNRARFKWGYRGWRRKYPRYWVKIVTCPWGETAGEILHAHHTSFGQSYHKFALLVDPTPKTAVLVRLLSETVALDLDSMSKTIRPVLPVVTDPHRFSFGRKRRAPLRDEGPNGQPYYISQHDHFYFWNGEDQTIKFVN